MADIALFHPFADPGLGFLVLIVVCSGIGIDVSSSLRRIPKELERRECGAKKRHPTFDTTVRRYS